jgi:hypothetical protein
MFIGADSKREARGMFWFLMRPDRICTLEGTPDSPNEEFIHRCASLSQPGMPTALP